MNVGKRDFLLQPSKYLKLAEGEGEDIVISHHSKPVLKIVPYVPKTIRDLKGCIRKYDPKEDINEPVFSGFDKW